VTDFEQVVGALAWITREMERRYKLFAASGSRSIGGYNHKVGAKGEQLPYLVVVIDELADLMMMAPDEVERHICRIAQMARATGIHLVVATQRPSVDVVTGLIKANFPTRIAFAVTSQIDSRVILDTPGWNLRSEPLQRSSPAGVERHDERSRVARDAGKASRWASQQGAPRRAQDAPSDGAGLRRARSGCARSRSTGAAGDPSLLRDLPTDRSGFSSRPCLSAQWDSIPTPPDG
jgi:hypothetical protein